MRRGEPISKAATETFERYRSLLFSIAYRMLGSVLEAEDVVQEAFLPWQEASGREPFAQVLPLEDRCPTLDRSAALRESPPRRVLRSLAPRAHRDRRGFGLGRRPGRDALDGVYGAPREPHVRRAGGVPGAGGLRFRLRGDSLARRQERGQLPPDLTPRAGPWRPGAPASRARPSRRSVSWTAFSKRA